MTIMDDPAELTDPSGSYTNQQVHDIVKLARSMGIAINRDVMQFTIRQLDRLVHGEYDA